MAITEMFLARHIRPYGKQGFETFCSRELIDFLGRLGFTSDAVKEILQAWRLAALADPYAQSDIFIRSAEAVAKGRWSEFKQTAKSTVMFLDAEQLAALTQARLGFNKRFIWKPESPLLPLKICVTIDESERSHVVWDNFTGFEGATDGNGMISHFQGLIRRPS